MNKLSLDRLSKLHPVVQAKAKAFFAAAEKAGITLLVTQGLRSMEEQDALYAKGRTVDGPVVTWAKAGYSWHNYGLAFDVVVLDAVGKMDWDASHPAWKTMGTLGMLEGLTWGGTWKAAKRDMPHFEYTGGLSLAQCRQHYKTGGIAEVWKYVH